MIGDVDRTLRRLLQESLGLAAEEVRFQRPDAQFAGSISADRTLCLYLYDIRENRELRRGERTVERRSNGTAEIRVPALRFDLSYLVTAWAKDVEEEHELLGRALAVLLAHPVLEQDSLHGSLKLQDVPIPTEVRQPDTLGVTEGLWAGLGGVRPALFYTLTIPVTPFPNEERRLVTARLLRVAEKERDQAAPVAARRPDETVELAGKVLGSNREPIHEAQVSLREVSRSATVDDRGIYRIGPLAPGRYTLVASAPGHREIRRAIMLSDQGGLGQANDAYELILEGTDQSSVASRGGA